MSSGGSATSAGSAGSAGSYAGALSGASGNAGSASFPECADDDDCEISKDCCACQAAPKAQTTSTCNRACASNACAGKGFAPLARCTLGRCTLANSCDTRGVSCKSLPPTCPKGETASVGKGCWGPCIAVTECADVTDCNDCGDAQCITFSDFGESFHCVARKAQCEVGNLCECLSPCGNFACSEQNGEVGCFCPAC